MRKIDLYHMLIDYAIAYRERGAQESITLNSHMNEYGGEPLNKETADAVLVDFINFIAAELGDDLALHTAHLDEPKHEVRRHDWSEFD